MTTEIEDNVGIDPNAEMYVISHPVGVTTMSWANVKNRTERLALNLVMEDYRPPTTGTREAYDAMKVLEAALKLRYDRTGEKAVAYLSMQLVGLEGYRVEAVDEEGDAPRRFIVGKSTGWIPVHLEIRTTRSTGGEPARLEYHSVKILEKTNR